MTDQDTDYASTGMSIREALVHAGSNSRQPKGSPIVVTWNGKKVSNSDVLQVPRQGIWTAEFLSDKRDIDQAFDIKTYGGWIELLDGTRVPLLRTWKDERYEDTVEYPYFAPDGKLGIWNVYKRTRGDVLVEEKWTDNAGLWVEQITPLDRIYHCSHADANPPDFGSLVFRVTVRAT
jgi:hypothetical protein